VCPGGQPQVLELRELGQAQACGDVAAGVVADRQVGQPIGRGDAAIQRTRLRPIRQPSYRCQNVDAVRIFHDHQGRTFGAPGLTAPAVNSEDGREQCEGMSGHSDPP
jgi:hypothetical protein